MLSILGFVAVEQSEVMPALLSGSFFVCGSVASFHEVGKMKMKLRSTGFIHMFGTMHVIHLNFDLTRLFKNMT